MAIIMRFMLLVTVLGFTTTAIRSGDLALTRPKLRPLADYAEEIVNAHSPATWRLQNGCYSYDINSTGLHRGKWAIFTLLPTSQVPDITRSPTGTLVIATVARVIIDLVNGTVSAAQAQDHFWYSVTNCLVWQQSETDASGDLLWSITNVLPTNLHTVAFSSADHNRLVDIGVDAVLNCVTGIQLSDVVVTNVEYERERSLLDQSTNEVFRLTVTVTEKTAHTIKPPRAFLVEVQCDGSVRRVIRIPVYRVSRHESPWMQASG